jgi:hypothetical protein
MEYIVSNQRPGKMQKATFQSSDSMLRQAIAFARDAEEALERQGEGDAAFYFGQLKDWLTDNPRKGFSESAQKILGL